MGRYFSVILIVFVLTGFSVPVCASDPSQTFRELSRDDSRQPAGDVASGKLVAQNTDDTFFPDDLRAADEKYQIADPIAPFNKAMFQFNDKFYFWVLKPVAQGYKNVVPTVARTGIKNFFNNLGMPVRTINALLQLDGYKAGVEVGRFVFNTTVGVLGFGNPAGQWEELNPPEEDTGQTLGVYGLGHGFYIVWPILGPSSVRDTFGLVGDHFLDPVTYVNPWELRTGADVTDTVNDTSFRIGQYEAFKDAALVPYDSMRNAYVQRREKSLNE